VPASKEQVFLLLSSRASTSFQVNYFSFPHTLAGLARRPHLLIIITHMTRLSRAVVAESLFINIYISKRSLRQPKPSSLTDWRCNWFYSASGSIPLRVSVWDRPRLLSHLPAVGKMSSQVRRHTHTQRNNYTCNSQQRQSKNWVERLRRWDLVETSWCVRAPHT